MDELREVKGERGRLNTQALGDHAGWQPFRPASDQQAEQTKPGFLGERTKGRNRTFLIHNDVFPCFNDHQIICLVPRVKVHFENC